MTDLRAHTPGPWRIRPNEYDDWGWIRAANGELVAIARPGEHLTSAQESEHRRAKTDPTEANARLIAASPQMLGALKAALPHLDNSGSPGGCDGTQYECDHCAAIRLVRAAIRNAEGATKGVSAGK